MTSAGGVQKFTARDLFLLLPYWKPKLRALGPAKGFKV